ncbi:hypothetical protein FOA43_002824 [Brettanomyces nanus]|uniref:Rad21/Rec8-like protein N-terminal domain-containing protein n=1 Tax=Eeniella nana TaxID=13502 RepID=A0A875S6X7_EENNA|nr:uncharacterized protein FOA43_002824 [Brettanomyces nanus]QPG75469.1 hypothetical protein FOA43_002824 [Brettanomyces nanus]
MSLPDVCATVISEAEDMSLRRTSSLLYGIVLVFKHKVNDIYRESSSFKSRINQNMSFTKRCRIVVAPNARCLVVRNLISVLTDDPCFDVNIDFLQEASQILQEQIGPERNPSEINAISGSSIDESLEHPLSAVASSPMAPEWNPDFTFDNSGEAVIQPGNKPGCPIDFIDPGALFGEQPEVTPIPRTALMPAAEQPSPKVRPRKRMHKIQNDMEISFSMPLIKKFHYDCLQRYSTQKKKQNVSSNMSFPKPFVQLLKSMSSERTSNTRRSSSVSSIEQGRRMSMPSSVEQGRRVSEDEQELPFNLNQLEEQKQLPLDFNFEGDDTLMNISFGKDGYNCSESDDMTMSQTTLDARIRDFLNLQGGREVSFEEICPSTRSTRKETTSVFQIILYLATNELVHVELEETVLGKSKWELLSGTDIRMKVIDP